MGLLGVARENTAVGVCPEAFLLLLLQASVLSRSQLCSTHCLLHSETAFYLRAVSGRGFGQCQDYLCSLPGTIGQETVNNGEFPGSFWANEEVCGLL
jgi:hypothetical protein